MKGKTKATIGPYQHHISKGITQRVLEALYTALHEVGHGIERDWMPGRKTRRRDAGSVLHRPFDGNRHTR